MTYMNGNGPETSSPAEPSSALARAARFEQEALVVEHEEQHLDQEKMVEWILNKSDPKHKKLQCESFLLFHDHKVQGLVCVATGATIPKKGISAEDKSALVAQIVEEFAEESEARAQRFAPDLQGFQVSAYVKEADDDDPGSKGADPTFTRYFNVTPAGSLTRPNYQGNSEGTGDVDAVQIVSGLQRQNEILIKQITHYIGSSQERVIDWSTSVMQENTVLRAQAFDQSVKTQELLDDRARRDAEAIEKKMHVEAQWQLLQGAMTVGKGLFERYMQSAVMPLPPGAAPARELAADPLVPPAPGAEPASGAAPSAPPAQAAAPAANPLADLGVHLSPQELVGIVGVLSEENSERFRLIAMSIVGQMPPDKQQMVGALLQRLQEERAKERAQKAAESEIKVTQVATPPAPPSKQKKGR